MNTLYYPLTFSTLPLPQAPPPTTTTTNLRNLVERAHSNHTGRGPGGVGGETVVPP